MLVYQRSTDGEVANAPVCKTGIHGFKSHSVLHPQIRKSPSIRILYMVFTLS